MAICGDLSLCHDFQDLYVMVKNSGYVPGVDPQWDRGRIAFKEFCSFTSAVTALSAERRGASERWKGWGCNECPPPPLTIISRDAV